MKIRKIFKRLALTAVILAIGLAGFDYLWLAPRYTVPILMYHGFSDDPSTLFVTPENFRRQLTYLKKKNYNVISMDELAEGIKSGKKFARNTVVITIDDGYADNFTRAYPVLKKYDFPATIFLITDFIGKKNDYLDWEDVKAMRRGGVTFGGHTMTNAYLPSVKTRQGLWREIRGSKDAIEAKLGNPVYYFCYPTGAFNEDVKKVTKEAGYRAACTTNRGHDRFNRDLYELNRIKITNSDTNRPLSLWIKLTGYYNLFRSQKEGH